MTQKCPRQFSKSRLKFVDVMGQIEWSRKSRVSTTRIPRERGREEEKKFENNRDFVHCQSSYESLSNFLIAHRANINFSFLTIFYAFIARTLGLNSLISTLDTLVSCELLLYLVVRLSLCISRIFGSTCYAIVMLLNQADLVFPVVQLLC